MNATRPANPDVTDTVFPNTFRRRVWAHPDVKSHSLVILTSDRLHLAPLTGAPKPELVSAVEAGGNLDQLLGPLAVVVDLAEMRDVKLDLLTNSLVVEYGSVQSARVTFETAQAADACFTKLWRRLGDRFKLRPYKRDARDAARAPLLLLLAVLLVTAGLVLTISVLEDIAPRPADGDLAGAAPKRLSGPLGWLGWRGVCALGGAAAAGAQVWLYRRLTQPPVSLELVRV